MPVPPQQSTLWTAPTTTLPTGVLSACYDLFDAGMSDPRGCAYREVVVKIEEQSEEDNATKSITTHGWVLPSSPNAPVPYAVCWNGLTYPLVSVGPPADLDADIGKLLDASSAASSHDPTRPSLTESLAFDELTLVKVPLLLRLNQVKPAEKLWQRWSALAHFNIRDKGQEDLGHIDPFSVLFREWLWAQFSRAQQAHLCGDAKLALAYLRPLPDLRKRVEQMAAGRGVFLAKVYAGFRAPDQSLDLMFLDHVPALLEDEQRRVRENVTNRDEEYNPDKITDKKERIALLIRDLEDVEAYPFLSDGYITFGASAVVEALVKQGDDAVDPLLDCLEHDHRLTRTFDNGGARHFQTYGYARIIGVEEPAFCALQGILKTRDQFSPLKEPYVNMGSGNDALERTALAAQIRDYWSKKRNKTLPQRWYDTLADDHAKPEAWAEAAGNIVLPDDADLFSGFGMLMRGHQSDAPVHFHGEVLRSESHPSVSELLIKRLRETFADAKASHAYFPFEPVKKLATALAKWDGKNQIETLRWYGDELKKTIQTQTEYQGPGEIDELVKIYLARKEAGDASALRDYAQWIQSTDAKKLTAHARSYGATFFSPVWSYPDDPAIAALTKWLFQDSSSPWSPAASDVDPGWVINSTHLPLVAVPAFRAMLVRDLEDKKIAGSVEITSEKVISPDITENAGVAVNFGKSGGGSYAIEDPDTPPAGTKGDLRLCDIIAFKLSEIRGVPRCQPFWPVNRRDQAIRDTILFLQHYGDRWAHKATAQEEIFSSFNPMLHFPTLDHPATREEVAAGRAIFSLEGKGERKVWPLPTIPKSVTWIALKDYPYVRQVYISGSKQAVTMKGYDQDGLIWQAEEVLVHGKWQRYFGFVGKNCLAVVPGDEIQFDGGDFNDSTDGWGLVVALPQKNDSLESWPNTTGKLGGPVSIQIWTENLRGIARAFPPFVHEPGPVSAEDAGMEMSIDYSPHPINDRPPLESEWKPVAAKAPIQIDLQSLPATLAPMEKHLLFQCDLAKFYDFKLPGDYRLSLKFKKGGLLNSEWSMSPQLELTK